MNKYATLFQIYLPSRFNTGTRTDGGGGCPEVAPCPGGTTLQ